EHRDLALGLARLEAVPVAHRDSCRVVAAILEAFEAFDQKAARLAFTYVANDSAHKNPSVSVTRSMRLTATAIAERAHVLPYPTEPRRSPARSVPCRTAEREPTGRTRRAAAHLEYRPSRREMPREVLGTRYPNLRSVGRACPSR